MPSSIAAVPSLVTERDAVSFGGNVGACDSWTYPLLPDPVFKLDHWRVCSALVADCYLYAKADLTEGLEYPNLVSPADLYNTIAREA